MIDLGDPCPICKSTTIRSATFCQHCAAPLTAIEVRPVPPQHSGSPSPLSARTPEELGKELEQVIAKRKIGEALQPTEAALLAEVMAHCIENAPARLRLQKISYELGLHDTIKYLLLDWFEKLGFPSETEVPYAQGGFTAEEVRFDIVVQLPEMPLIIEVKVNLDPNALGQVQGYADMLDAAGERASLAIGGAIEAYPQFLTGRVGSVVRKLMEREHVGVILADRHLLFMFTTYRQLILEEMPWIVGSEGPVGMIRRS